MSGRGIIVSVAAAAAVVGAGAGAVPAAAAPAATATSAVTASRSPAQVTVATPSRVVTGQRFVVRGVVKHATSKTRVVLQRPTARGWARVGRPVPVSTSGRYTVAVRAGEVGRQAYRVVASTPGRRSAVSATTRTTVYAWLDLDRLRLMSATDTEWGRDTVIDGVRYARSGTGWDSGHATFDTRRSCISFRAVAGVEDRADSATAGTITLETGTRPVTAVTVARGRTARLSGRLTGAPHFTIRGAEANPGDTSVEDRLAIGRPQVLCSFRP